jgi:outer membrane protein OmpA-like peptidoglycan-associated protein
VVDISEDGYVGRPRNLGDIVNTNKREMYPYIDENDILYFSSEGFDDTKGMLDVYATKLKADGTYYKPINLGATINSNKDDFSFTKHKGMNTGHFSSNRSGGKGGDDIYAFIQNSPEDFESDRLVTGQITDKNSGELLPGALAILYDENGLELNRQTVGNDATYNFEVKKNKTYKIKGNIEVYSKQIEEFTTKGDNCIIKIETIYFDLNSSILRSEAILELDKVVQIMRKYPAIIIESSSHTDSRESDQYNNWISEKRAKRSMDYIVSKGIHPNRISAKGYGETQLINSCSNGTYCSEASHQLNRRTEFRIVNFNEIKNRYPDICLPK